ncbi:hypothetical protein BC834DRAFT_7954 [Gloeopeniophorella convolvens]|nr:hypothetical protein BC834DRAFT_7954 [Gloeopeniophorella convolvens]
MYQLINNTVTSVKRPALLVVLAPEAQRRWCQQFSEEGYNVMHISQKENSDSENDLAIRETSKYLGEMGGSWAIVSYGLAQEDESFISALFKAAPTSSLRTCVHFTISSKRPATFVPQSPEGTVTPTMVHLASSQEESLAAFQLLAESGPIGPRAPGKEPLLTVHAYPKVPSDPPFPFECKAPALVQAGETSSVDPYIRSATNLSYSRTLALLRKELGPYLDLEKLWEKHTYYEFVERDAPKTMSTMVKAPYVNHVATLTGGVGYDDLARFYKYHFTGINVCKRRICEIPILTTDQVTPPDTELITVSRTVGADRIIDEMIFKATHTTEIDYFLPGIKPTGKPFEIALVGVVAFRGDKLTFEHIYWDQASVLVQLGLLDPSGLPVAGIEVARKVLDPFGVSSNKLMAKWKESEGLSVD